MRITVVGCGVSGLTTSIALRRAGHQVDVVARDLPHDCVSVVAGAIWGPTTVEPVERTGPWALESRRRFAELAEIEGSGVRPMIHLDLRHDNEPHWGESTPWVTRLLPPEVPAGYTSALRIDGFAIDPPIYLQWLLDEYAGLGGHLTIDSVQNLDELDGEAVVNCSGLGARDLVGDRSMFGIRGQMVLVANDGVTEGVSDETDPNRISYVYPRIDHLYLGGARDIGDSRPDPDPALTDRIVQDAGRLDPRVVGRSIVGERVGFRPGRPEVRLEADALADGRPVVHNYGHGGAGYIMSWGCAAEVVGLLPRA